MKTFIAIVLYTIGIQHYTSSDICGQLVYGYGKLHSWGFEYPIPDKHIN